MLLYLVRHGKAEAGADDAARRLTREGSSAVQRMAQLLTDSGIKVERIEHSGLVRAAETASILAEAVDGKSTKVGGLGPSDNVASAAARLSGCSERSIMLVGHIPFMERLASYLLTGDADTSLLHFRASAIACLSNGEGHWLLEWFLAPALA